MTFKEYVQAYGEAFQMPFTETQLQSYETFYNMVVETNQVMNLTSIVESKEFALKHIIDSLSCYDTKYITSASKVLDLGTGAGFPGIPLAIYDSSLHITLFDSLQKRLRFLDSVIDTLQLQSIRTLHGRAEDVAHTVHRESFDIVTSRAVARLPILLEWALPYVVPGGYFIALKGPIYDAEISESKRALELLGGSIEEVKEIKLPTLDDKRVILYIKKVGTTPKRYPRKPKDIKNRPL